MAEISQSVSSAISTGNSSPSLNANIDNSFVSNGIAFASLLQTPSDSPSLLNDGLQISVDSEKASASLRTVEEDVDSELDEEEVLSETEEQMTVLTEGQPRNHLQVHLASENEPQVRVTDPEVPSLGAITSLRNHEIQSDIDSDGLTKSGKKTQMATFGATIVHDRIEGATPLRNSPEAFDLSDKPQQNELSQALSSPQTKPNQTNIEEPPLQGPVKKLRDASTAGVVPPQHRDQALVGSNLSSLPQEHLDLDLTNQARRSHSHILADRSSHAVTKSADQRLDTHPSNPQKLFDTVGEVESKIHHERVLPVETPPRLSNSSSMIQTQSAPTSNQPEARFIAHQLGTHLANQKERTTTIRLNPEELGQVRMTLRTSETGVTLAIFAERPETSEIMRRNIDVLAQEFQSMGFENLDFQFEGESSDKAPEPPADHISADEGDIPQNLSSAPKHETGLYGRLDMRI